MARLKRQVGISEAGPFGGRCGRVSAKPGGWMKLSVLVLLILIPGSEALAQNRLTMMPPQIASPAGDIYMWGDRLIISFRVTGDASQYAVGVILGEGDDHLQRPDSEENIITFELPLDQDNLRNALSDFAQGALYIYGRAVIQSGGENIIEKPFWVMNPARRWPDAIRLAGPPGENGEREIKLSVTMPEDRVQTNYFLDLVRLPMLLPGGTMTTPEIAGEQVAITGEVQDYTIPANFDSGVYEIRLRGLGGFIHDIRRFQLSAQLPEVGFTDKGLVTTTADGIEMPVPYYAGQFDVSNYPADKAASLEIRTVGDAQVYGNYRQASSQAGGESWSAEVLFLSPGEIEVTTSHLEDEIILGKFSIAADDTLPGPRDGPLEFFSDKHHVLAPGDSFTVLVDPVYFMGGSHLWFFLRKNVSGRRPSNAPPSLSDRMIERWRVETDGGPFLVTIPGAEGEYRLDLEMPDDDGEPSGMISNSYVISAIDGEDDATIELPEEQFILGQTVLGSVVLNQRSYAAPVTLEVVRLGGESSNGIKYVDQTPPMLNEADAKQTLWDYDRSNAILANPFYEFAWRTYFWAPGRYEGRVIAGDDDNGHARVLGRKTFEIVVPDMPGAITSVEVDEDSDFYLAVDIDLPDWADPDLNGYIGWPYDFQVAVVRPRSRTISDALRFEEILDRTETDVYDFLNEGGKGQIRINQPYIDGEYEVWLLQSVYCFANTCPSAIVDRKTFTVDRREDDDMPAPDHIAEHFVFPGDDSINRPGRAFPDLVPNDSGN